MARWGFVAFGGRMPKSRGRKRKKPQRRSVRGGNPALRDLGEFAPYLRVLGAADAAEARGDAAEALGLMAGHQLGPDGKPFWKPERWRRLAQLWVFGPLLPRWATSRWILAQAVQHLGSRDRGRKALDIAIRARGGAAALPGRDAMDAQCRVMDHDWVYRQVLLYELGGLEHFVGRAAFPDLLAAAESLDAWLRPPMGAFVLESASSRSLAWRDLASGDPLGTHNLGALVEVGDFVIGRPVPVEDGTIFESAPLVVSERGARRVAQDPQCWIEVVADEWRRPQGGDDSGFSTHVGDYGLVTDLPFLVRGLIAQSVAPESDSPGHGAEDPMTVHLEEQVALVRAAMRGRASEVEAVLDIDPWPAVAAAVLDPFVYRALTERLSPDDAAAVRSLIELLPEPAPGVCTRLMEALTRAA